MVGWIEVGLSFRIRSEKVIRKDNRLKRKLDAFDDLPLPAKSRGPQSGVRKGINGINQSTKRRYCCRLTHCIIPKTIQPMKILNQSLDLKINHHPASNQNQTPKFLSKKESSIVDYLPLIAIPCIIKKKKKSLKQQAFSMVKSISNGSA